MKGVIEKFGIYMAYWLKSIGSILSQLCTFVQTFPHCGHRQDSYHLRPLKFNDNLSKPHFNLY